MSGNSKDQASSDGANQLASGPVLARWLGISGKAVYDLAKAGILVRVSRDQFSLEDSVRRYCAHIRQSASQLAQLSPRSMADEMREEQGGEHLESETRKDRSPQSTEASSR